METERSVHPISSAGFGPKSADSCRFPFSAREPYSDQRGSTGPQKHSLIEGSFCDRGVVLALERCFEVTEEVLRTVFNQLYTQRVTLRGMIVKPNKVLPGLTCPKAGSGGPRCCWRRAI